MSADHVAFSTGQPAGQVRHYSGRARVGVGAAAGFIISETVIKSGPGTSEGEVLNDSNCHRVIVTAVTLSTRPTAAARPSRSPGRPITAAARRIAAQPDRRPRFTVLSPL
eukprot:756607-Hanusia_phi.AAC.1